LKRWWTLWTYERACQSIFVDISKISNGWEKNQVPFGMVEETWSHGPNYWLLAQQILGIVGFQIEIEKIFSLVSILIKLRRDIGCNKIALKS